MYQGKGGLSRMYARFIRGIGRLDHGLIPIPRKLTDRYPGLCHERLLEAPTPPPFPTAGEIIELLMERAGMLCRADGAYYWDTRGPFIFADLGAVDNGRTAALGSKDVTNGVHDAADSTLTALASAASNALIIYKHTGSDATARVIAYLDSAVGLPFTPEAAQACPIVWDNGANKIFAL